MEKGCIKRFGTAAMAVFIVFMLVTMPALAKLALNTIDPIVTLSSNNRHVLVTGPIKCDQGEKLSLEVILTQWDTGAVAKGKLETSCTGDIQKWEINTNTEGTVTFKEDKTAIAWASATTRKNGKITDVDQWSREVTVKKSE